jgi:Mn-dependent DtxR family transcriptional regulator
MNEPMRRRREQRREFLRLLYDAVDGSVSEFIPASTIAERLGLEEAETRRIFEYLEEKQLVVVDDHRSGIIRLTAAGVDEVEASA